MLFPFCEAHCRSMAGPSDVAVVSGFLLTWDAGWTSMRRKDTWAKVTVLTMMPWRTQLMEEIL